MKLSKEKIQSGKLDTYIGEETTFEGTLSSKKSLTIYGNVKGEIECQGRVVVGESGSIEADITANDVAVNGKVVGNVTAKGKLEMSSSGVVQGDIRTPRLIMEEGCRFDGRCEMLPGGKATVIEKVKAEDATPVLQPQEKTSLPSASRS